MPKPKVLILRAPGTNCDVETAFAFETAGAEPTTLHLNRLLESPAAAEDYQILCLPGGFSYGDDMGAGRVFGNQIRYHLADRLHRFRDEGKLLLGICNGFQILIKSGLLLDDAETGPPATLTTNDSGKFEDRWVRLRVAGGKSVFLDGVEQMYLPVAHAEGKFVARDEATLNSLDKQGQLVLRYAPLDGSTSLAAAVDYPANPNGAQRHVAGVCDASGRVLGLMPHPERYIDPTQHPRWTRNEGGLVGDGLKLFQNAVKFFA